MAFLAALKALGAMGESVAEHAAEHVVGMLHTVVDPHFPQISVELVLKVLESMAGAQCMPSVVAQLLRRSENCAKYEAHVIAGLVASVQHQLCGSRLSQNQAVADLSDTPNTGGISPPMIGDECY